MVEEEDIEHEEQDDPADDVCRKDSAMMGASKALRYPLFLAALYHQHTEMKLGPSKKKIESIDLGTLSNPRSPWRQKCDDLQFLPGQVTVYLQNYHARELGIPVCPNSTWLYTYGFLN